MTESLTPEREAFIDYFQSVIDTIEKNPSIDLLELEPETKLRGQKAEVARLQKEGELYGVKGIRSKIKGYVTRNNQYTIFPFVIDQRDEPTCAYVTLSKVLVFNLMGIMMDIDLSPSEKTKLHRHMKGFPVTSNTNNASRFLKPYANCSVKGYVLILFFFYFFDWIKKNEMRPFLLKSKPKPVEVSNLNGQGDYKLKLKKLYTFLHLKIKRLGGTTFSGSEWIQTITTLLELHAKQLEWKRTSLCTLKNELFSKDSPTLSKSEFNRFCNEVILPITNQGIKLTLTLYSEEEGLHDVMLVGVENDALLISNSWGHSIDVTPIELLPKVTLKHARTEWVILQFTFLLPIEGDRLKDLKPQYNLHDYETFESIMKTYKVPTFSKVDPTKLGLKPSGGTRKRHFNKSKRQTRK